MDGWQLNSVNSELIKGSPIGKGVKHGLRGYPTCLYAHHAYMDPTLEMSALIDHQ